MELYRQDDPDALKRFLDDFCKKHSGENDAVGDIIPFRAPSALLREEEREPETLDWVVSYLTAKKCPNVLSALIARAVWEDDDILNLDLTSYIEPLKTKVNDEEDSEDNEDGSSEDKEMEGESNVKYLNAEKLTKPVIKKVIEICHNYQKKLPTMPQSKRKFDVSVDTIKNIRRRMEDRHVVMPHFNSLFGLKDSPHHAYFAVFDGHGGLEAAIYTSQHLHYNMVHDTSFLTSTDTAMHDSFCKTDNQFLEKAKAESFKSGSTGVCVLLRDETLYYSWLGDSQFVLVCDGEPVELMQPHKPEREDEKKRIEALGGCVVWYGAWRVNGSLSVSRAIGDPDFKPYVSSEPDVGTFELKGNEDYMVLACDGLWDVITSDMLVQLVYKHLHEENGDKSTVATYLMDAAMDEGSSDNISIIVVFFRDDIAKPKKAAESSTDGSKAALDKNDDDSSGKDGGGDKNVPDNNDKTASGGSNESSNKPVDDSEKRQGNDSDDKKTSDNEDSIKDGKSTAENIGECSNSAKLSVELIHSRTLLPNDVIDSDSVRLDVEHPEDLVQVEVSQLQDVRSTSKKLPSENLPGCSDDVVQSDQHETSPNVPRIHSASQINALLQNSDVQSDVSSTDVRLMSQSASRCLRNRRVKRVKGASRRKNSRRVTREKSGRGGSTSSSSSSGPTGSATTAGRMPSSGIIGSTTAPSSHATMKLSRTADNLLLDASSVLTRYTRCRGRSLGNWTVAVEIESASAMFND